MWSQIAYKYYSIIFDFIIFHSYYFVLICHFNNSEFKISRKMKYNEMLI